MITLDATGYQCDADGCDSYEIVDTYATFRDKAALGLRDLPKGWHAIVGSSTEALDVGASVPMQVACSTGCLAALAHGDARPSVAGLTVEVLLCRAADLLYTEWADAVRGRSESERRAIETLWHTIRNCVATMPESVLKKGGGGERMTGFRD